MASPRELPRDSELLKKMRQRFKLANESEAEQDERERDDIAFEDDQQWPLDIQMARAAQQPANGMPSVPARPTLVINKLKEPVRHILNQERAADIGIEITPADDFGDLGITPDDSEITLREGLVRRIQRASHAGDARRWAFKRAVIAGRGYYIVRTRYLPGRTMDQEIYIDRIFNQAGVKLDPSHEKPDGSDADWEFIGTWCPWDRFQAEYPKDAEGKGNPLTNSSDDEFMGLTEAYPDWYRKADGEDGERAVRIVDYWYTERENQDVGITADGRLFNIGTPPADATPEEAAQYAPEGMKFAQTRTVTTKTIKFVKVAGGCMVLEQTTESGPDMPIVKVLGDEVLPYDEQRRANGVVRPARGSQMGFNAMVSKQVEMVGLTPIPPLQLDPEAIDGYENWYAVSSTRALPYLPYRSVDDQGRSLGRPERLAVDPNIYPISQSVSLFDQLIRSTTTVPDPTMGNVDPSLKSGRAIKETVLNAELSTSNFLDNLARSMEYEGQVINNKLYAIYGSRPGRLVRVMTGQLEQETVQIQDPAAMQMQQQALKVAKLTKDAHFNVIIKITKNADSRRTQENNALGELIGAEPTMMTWFGDLYFKSSDTPNRNELADRAKVMLAPPIQQQIAAKAQGNQPPDPQLQQAQQMIQQLQQALQQAQSGDAAKQAEIQSRERIAQAELMSKRELAQMDAQVKLQIAQMGNQATLQKTGAELQQRQAQAIMDNETQRHDALLRDQGNLRDTLSAVDSQAAEHAHQREQAMRQTMQPRETP